MTSPLISWTSTSALCFHRRKNRLSAKPPPKHAAFSSDPDGAASDLHRTTSPHTPRRRCSSVSTSTAPHHPPGLKTSTTWASSNRLLCAAPPYMNTRSPCRLRHSIENGIPFHRMCSLISLKDLIGNRNLGVSLEVVHRHGPCTKIKSTSTGNALDHMEIFQLDQERVDSIHSRVSALHEPLAEDNAVPKKKSATLTSKSGTSIGTGNFVVSIGLGTPQKTLSLVFDTGSDLTWTQCKPCAVSCYTQVDPSFEPAASTTYSNVSCTSATCMELMGQAKATPKCSRSTGTCVYGVVYGDSSFSVGYLAKERLTLTSLDYVDGFVFGCGESNQGLFGGTAGLLGLGRDKLSVVSQAAPKYGNYFSYCLPPHPSSTGHLTFGKGGTRAKTMSYTPLVKSSKSTPFYLVALEYISVGGIRLSIAPKVFSSANTLIDSGTVITRLPPQAYSTLSAAFKKLMSKYTSAPTLSILDTCFDLSAYHTVSVPKVVLGFLGGAALDLPLSGILFAFKPSQVCLAFTGNSMDTSPAIIGNLQQKSFDVVYDVDGGKIGFGPNAC